MQLKDIATSKPTRQISKVFESYFDSKMNFDRMNAKQCKTMLSKVRSIIGEARHSVDFHQSQNNPAYLKLMMLEQALWARLAETIPPVPGQPTTPSSTTPSPTTPSPTTPTTQVDPKLKTAQDKLKKGQTLSPDEQKLINATAAAMTENKLRRAYKMLKESEIQQAQVVLAAQDMVDKMQSMLEDISELQFKELPALVDSIKNQVGMDQAAQFNADATAALTGLLQNIQGAKQQLDQALGVVTGQSSPADAGLASVTSPTNNLDQPGDAAGMAAGDETDAALNDLDAAAADAGAQDPSAPAASLGRSRR